MSAFTLPATSHALQITAYGDTSVFNYVEVPTPQITNPQDVIVRVTYSSVNPIDWKTRKGFMQVLEKVTFPHILGKDFTGEVVAKGDQAKFLLGDKVFGVVPNGAYAEYLRVNTERDIIGAKPASLPSEEAGGTPLASLAAWHSLVELGNLPYGENAEQDKYKVLIIGASGGVGTFAVQFAKVATKAKVTAITSGANEKLVLELGADRVVDYTQQDFAEALKDDGDFDLVVDTIGDQGNYEKTAKLLKKTGVYAAVATEINEQKLTFGDLAKFGATVLGRKISEIFGASGYKPLLDVSGKDFPKLIPYLERREVKPIIGYRFPLQDGAKAHEKSESLHAAGKIILEVSPPSS